jgi:hypothetical protein
LQGPTLTGGDSRILVPTKSLSKDSSGLISPQDPSCNGYIQV